MERVLGKLEEHKDATDKRLDRLEHKIDSLLHWKWSLLGGSAAISAIIAICIEWYQAGH